MSSYDAWLEGPYTDGEDSCIENPSCIYCWSECEACAGLGTANEIYCDVCEGEGSVFDPDAHQYDEPERD